MTTDTKNLTASAYVPHLLAVLGEMTDYTAGIKIPQERTFEPVCARMGIAQDASGQLPNGTLWTHRRIGFAMRQMRDKQLTAYAAKGEWMLTEEGALTAAQEVGRKPGEPVREETLVARTHVSELDEADGEAGRVVQLRPRIQHPYSDDPYIRALAIAQTPCFGAFTSRSESCKACRLSHECIGALDARLAEIAAELDREEAIEKTKQAQQQKVRDSKDLATDELIESFKDTPNPTKKTAAPASGKFRPGPKAHLVKLATATADAQCLHCKKTIPKGTKDLTWIKDKGVLHDHCLDSNES